MDMKVSEVWSIAKKTPLKIRALQKVSTFPILF